MAIPDISNIGQTAIAKVTGIPWVTVGLWLVFFLLLGGLVIWGAIWWTNRKIWIKKITAFEIIGQYWAPAIRDDAKVVKVGTGGFEILYLKKLKTWRIAYGGRIGKDTYYFFIMPDGYWYNGMLLANLF